MPGKAPERKPFGRCEPPPNYPADPEQYADPQNYMYPLDKPIRAKLARRYFDESRNRSKYTEEERLFIDSRIDGALKRFGATIDEPLASHQRLDKRKLPKRILKRPTEPIPMEEPVPELPDRRAMEGVMRGFLGGLVGSREETPLSKAQDLMDKAFESHDPMKRVELAKKALELSPDCADAYVLLAENASSRKEALELYEIDLRVAATKARTETLHKAVGGLCRVLGIDLDEQKQRAIAAMSDTELEALFDTLTRDRRWPER